MSPAEYALKYRVAGIAVIPVGEREKGPRYAGWQNLRLAIDEIPDRFHERANIGMLNGEPSAGRSDVDLDHPLALELADDFLPETRAEFGRKSKRRSHRIYVAVGAKTKQFKIDKTAAVDPGKMIVELRSTGSQTILPGSVHPHGEAIEWDSEGEPTIVDAAELLACIERLAEEVCRRLGVKLSSTTSRSQEAKQLAGKSSERARAWIAAEPPAISGQGGHNRTFGVACDIWRFGASDDEAFSIMQEYNQRCEPQWTGDELRHKLQDARETIIAAGEFGMFAVTDATIPDLSAIAKRLGAKKDTQKGYLFPNFAAVAECVKEFGGDFIVPAEERAPIRDRQVHLFIERNSLQAAMQLLKKDPPILDGWNKRTSKWDCVLIELPERKEENVHVKAPSIDLSNIRHVLPPGGSGGKGIGWAMLINGKWVEQKTDNCISVLMYQHPGLKPSEASALLGGSILNAYELVDEPFAPEYPGGSLWNRFGAQLAFEPAPGSHKHFDMVLEHIGQSLDSAVLANDWCKGRRICNGAKYLKLWFASVFQQPRQLLPYLFFYGPQNIGKSSLHEMCGMLMTRGYAKVEKAFTRKNSFNAELAGVILAIIEEVNLIAEPEKAYAMMKESTTNPYISIERKGWDAYQQRNVAHFMQMSQKPFHCPILDPDDSRVVVGRVKSLPPSPISKPILEKRWREEAPAFLHHLLYEVELPEPSDEDDRLYLPVLSTPAKWEVIETVRKLQSMDPAQRPAGVIAQTIAEPTRQLAIDNWIVQKTCSELLAKFREMGIEGLPENPEQIGQALKHVNLSRFTLTEQRTNSKRLITIAPAAPADDEYYMFDEGPYTDDELYADEVRCANLF